VDSDLVVPYDALPENLKQSMGAEWRKRQEYLRLMREREGQQQ
jgi:ribonuclease Z